MKKAVLPGVSSVFLMLIISLPLQAASTLTKADSKALWEYITKISPYKNWKPWPDHKGMQPGKALHGPFHKIFVNKAALDSPKPPVKYNSIIVKEKEDYIVNTARFQQYACY